MQSLWTGLNALKSASSWLDRVGDNLANENTVGFAGDTGSFADTLTTALSQQATAPGESGRVTPLGWWGGTGSMAVQSGRDFRQMPLQRTDNPMDFAISGPGFFVVQSQNGPALTKAGNFGWASAGNGNMVLSTPNGEAVLDVNGQPIVQPKGATAINAQITVAPDGQVSYGGQPGPKLAIAEVAVPSESLQALGNNLYSPKVGYTTTIVNRAASTNPTSTISEGYLAMSNVDVTTQMTDMIQAQRMFDLNAESIQMTNKMMQIADSIRA